MIKTHLKNPTRDGIALLERRQIFMLTLDGVPTVAKVAKGFNNMALGDQLFAKITSDSMAYLKAHAILLKIVKDNFRRKIEYEIMQVQKSPKDNHAFLITTSPEQHMKMIKSQVVIVGEILTPITTRPTKLTDKEKAKRNGLVLIVQNINRAKPVAEVKTAIKGLLGTKNVANIFFPNQEEQLYIGIANTEVTMPATYKQYVTKNIKMLNHYMKFTPHPHSLDRLAASNKTQLKEFGFIDINIALANTVESLRNTPGTSTLNVVSKAEIAEMVKEAVIEGNKTLKHEILTDMQEIKETIIEEANNYARVITNDFRGKLDQKLKMLMDAVEDTRGLFQLALLERDQLN